MFQSPRKSGRGRTRDPRQLRSTKDVPRSFNPLGSGAGSDSRIPVQVDLASAKVDVSIPSEAGRGRTRREIRGTAADLDRRCFNPLGSGAGSDSATGSDARPRTGDLRSFQSPRKRGGVGLIACGIGPIVRRASTFQSPRKRGGVGLSTCVLTPVRPRYRRRFNPLGGGAGSDSRGLSRLYGPDDAAVSIPSEAGRGRTRISQPPAVRTCTGRVSIPSEAGRGRTRTSTGVICGGIGHRTFQSPRKRGGVGLGGPPKCWSDKTWDARVFVTLES